MHKEKDVTFSSLFSSLKRIVNLVKKDCSRIDCHAGGRRGLMAVLRQSFCIQSQARELEECRGRGNDCLEIIEENFRLEN